MANTAYDHLQNLLVAVAAIEGIKHNRIEGSEYQNEDELLHGIWGLVMGAHNFFREQHDRQEEATTTTNKTTEGEEVSNG